MNFRLLILLGILAFSSSVLLSQQRKFVIQTVPDSAIVLINGVNIGTTPLTEYQSFKGKEDTMYVEILKDGYVREMIILPKKNSTYLVEKTIKLKPDYTFTIDSSAAMVAFEKMIAEFPNGKELGQVQGPYERSATILTWEGYSRVADESFEIRANDLMGSAGFKTPASASSQLFADQRQIKQTPKFIVGAKMVDLWVDLLYNTRASYTHPYRYDVKMTVEWQVFDKALSKVVYVSKTLGHIKGGTARPTDGDELLVAFDVAFTHFLMDGKLAEMANASVSASSALTTQNAGTQTKTAIPKVASTPFASSSEMIQTATQSCVTIETDAGHGSGAFVGATGYILTAYHVVGGTNRVEAILPTGMKLPAKLIAFDESHDIALLQIPGSGYKPLPLGDSKGLGPGADVFTIGTPMEIELGQSVSKGIVSGKRKVEEIIYIQTDVSVSPGNSGGPLLNSKGELIGVIQRKLVATGVEGVGFALPVETALERLGIVVE